MWGRSKTAIYTTTANNIEGLHCDVHERWHVVKQSLRFTHLLVNITCVKTLVHAFKLQLYPLIFIKIKWTYLKYAGSFSQRNERLNGRKKWDRYNVFMWCVELVQGWLHRKLTFILLICTHFRTNEAVHVVKINNALACVLRETFWYAVHANLSWLSKKTPTMAYLYLEQELWYFATN